MNKPPPIMFEWDGDSMKPLPHFVRACDRQFVVGAKYRMEVSEERSGASHNHYFAAINEAWQNLPPQYAERYPTAEHLRKRALIHAGYYDEQSIVASSDREAQRIAAFIGGLDEYAVVVVRSNVVTRLTARSQSARDMNKQEFQASKTAVLDALAKLIGVETRELERHAGRAA